MNRCRQCGAPTTQTYCQACAPWFTPQQAQGEVDFFDPYETVPNPGQPQPYAPVDPVEAPVPPRRGVLPMVIGGAVVAAAVVVGFGLLLAGGGDDSGLAVPSPPASSPASTIPSATAQPTAVVTVTRTAIASAPATTPPVVDDFIEQSFVRYSSTASGNSGYTVRALQGLLTASGVKTLIDGDFGPATERSVLEWQRSQGLYPSGIVDDTTWESLTPKLQVGAEGAAVEALQRLLDDQGYSTTVDGHFGEKTAASVRAFQAQYNLTVDGIVGQETWPILLA